MGRAALMPELVANACLDCLNEDRQDLISEILQFHTARLGGIAAYLRHARKTIKSGRASLVTAERA